MNHNCDQCDGKYDCGYGNPCSSHGEQIWCSKECQEDGLRNIPSKHERRVKE
jgi:hypothetical protein